MSFDPARWAFTIRENLVEKSPFPIPNVSLPMLIVAIKQTVIYQNLPVPGFDKIIA